MNQKQRKEIAKMWSAAILLATGMDAFDYESDISEDDQGKIVSEVETIAYNLLKERPVFQSLDQILDFVLGPSE